MKTFESLNAEIWVISNDPAAKLEKMRAKKGLQFPTLMDPDLAVAKRYGIEKPGGDLPHPTAIVVDPQGVATYVRVDENYAKRPKPEELIEALRAPASGS